MRRKKFIKYLMAAGHDRNTANVMAKGIENYREYYETLKPCLALYRCSGITMKEFSKALNKLAEAAFSFGTAAVQFREAVDDEANTI